jgi:hypothetical protein
LNTTGLGSIKAIRLAIAVNAALSPCITPVLRRQAALAATNSHVPDRPVPGFFRTFALLGSPYDMEILERNPSLQTNQQAWFTTVWMGSTEAVKLKKYVE